MSGDREVGDYRFFIRSIIRHSDLITSEASFDYLKNEGERLLLEALDELEMAFSHPMARKTDCNHVKYFYNFLLMVFLSFSTSWKWQSELLMNLIGGLF